MLAKKNEDDAQQSIDWAFSLKGKFFKIEQLKIAKLIICN